ncbi:MAG: hypothetical protein L0Y72_30010, partial [Gemmataceae bacterium]|nr:hypothetical protein [Gemmataceae bacterium]
MNPKNNGIRNVVVWLAPEPSAADLAALQGGRKKEFPSFDGADIHPTLAKPAKPSVEIDSPFCRFIPHVVVARAGQNMIIKNSTIVPHNVKWMSRNNDQIDTLIPSGGQDVVKDLKPERFPIEIADSIHPWMRAWVRVFDHPYFAVTDEDGNFEIKNAPVLKGQLRLFIWQENGMRGGAPGRFGQTLKVKPGAMDLKELKFDTGKKPTGEPGPKTDAGGEGLKTAMELEIKGYPPRKKQPTPGKASPKTDPPKTAEEPK